jgi:hypothetical protein
MAEQEKAFFRDHSQERTCKHDQQTTPSGDAPVVDGARSAKQTNGGVDGMSNETIRPSCDQAGNLDGILRADEGEVTAQLADEAPKIAEQPGVEIGLGMIGREVEELDEVCVLENRGRLRVNFSQR